MKRSELIPDNRVPIDEDCLTVQEWQVMLEQCEGRCFYCGRSNRKLTRDHIVPLASGGRHTASNIAPACLACNISKHSRSIEEFLSRRTSITIVRQHSGCGERVKSARLGAGLTAYGLSRRTGTAGVNAGTILKIERGQTEPRGETLHKIAAALGVTPAALQGIPE